MPKDRQQASQPLRFVKEGDADLETQLLLEKRERAKLDTDYKTKERLTLQEQLRLNAILKQENFNALVKDRNSFNRLSEDAVNFYKKLREKNETEKKSLEQSLELETRSFDQKKQALEQTTPNSTVKPHITGETAKRTQIPAKVSKPKSNSKNGLKGIVRKKKTEPSKSTKEKSFRD
ncbi:LAFA_0E08636g1_1 [Lachancea sp. 'fantastica']|nr:LAFA_0E08636g1_1 [Lachancea sp. 'fantastica']